MSLIEAVGLNCEVQFSHRAFPQLRPSGRHHGPGQSEPRALRDGGREGPLGEGVEDRRGVAAGLPRPRVSPCASLFPLRVPNHVVLLSKEH